MDTLDIMFFVYSWTLKRLHIDIHCIAILDIENILKFKMLAH